MESEYARKDRKSKSVPEFEMPKKFTYEDMIKEMAEEGKIIDTKTDTKIKMPPTPPKGPVRTAYSFLNNNSVGRLIRNTAIYGTIIGVSMVYGARNAGPINNAIDATVAQASMTVNTNTERIAGIAGKVDYILDGNPQDIGKFLCSKKEEYTGLLKKEPENTAAFEELKKLEALLGAYERIYNIKQ